MAKLVPILLTGILASASGTTFFKETFDSTWEDRWIQSAKADLGKFKHSAGKFYGDAEADKGIQTSQDAKFYGISSKFTPFDSKDKPLVIQFSVKHEQDIDCGGGYLKVMPTLDQTSFNGDSQYYVMFGPDVCGYTKKIHLIFNYKGKNLLWKKEPKCETDTLTHVYTAVINPDHTYEVLVDNVKKESGKLEEDWDFLPPKTIPDKDDKKPSDWVDEAEMVDPEDKKPEDWDLEPETIVDPEAAQPDDWDEEEDGKWEAPTIPNPKYKGKWSPKKIPNPKYKGVWRAKEIANPDYVEDANIHAYSGVSAVGFDLWQVKSGTIFDNIVIADSVADAKSFYDETTGKTVAAEKKAFESAEEKKKAQEEADRKARESEDKSEGDDEDDEEDEKNEEDKDEL